MAYTGQEENVLKKAAAYLADVALPEGATEIECEAAWALSVELNKVDELLAVLLAPYRSDEEFMAFSIAHRELEALMKGETYKGEA